MTQQEFQLMERMVHQLTRIADELEILNGKISDDDEATVVNAIQQLDK